MWRTVSTWIVYSPGTSGRLAGASLDAETKPAHSSSSQRDKGTRTR